MLYDDSVTTATAAAPEVATIPAPLVAAPYHSEERGEDRTTSSRRRTVVLSMDPPEMILAAGPSRYRPQQPQRQARQQKYEDLPSDRSERDQIIEHSHDHGDNNHDSRSHRSSRSSTSFARHDQLPAVEEIRMLRFGNKIMDLDDEDGVDLSAERQYNRVVRLFLGVGCFVLLAGVSLTVGIVAGKNAKEERLRNSAAAQQQNPLDSVMFPPALASEPSAAPIDGRIATSVPSPSPSSILLSQLDEIRTAVTRLGYSSNESALYDLTTPQGMACEWLAKTDKWKAVGGGDNYYESKKFSERYALAVIYYSLGGGSGNWLYNPKLMSATKDVCEWSMQFPTTGQRRLQSLQSWQPRESPRERTTAESEVPVGVQCEGGTFVYELYIPSNNMTGSLPSEVRLLSYLKNINLYNNQISGTIPGTIAENTNLVALQLHSNDFDAVTLPTVLGLLTKLNVINLSNNNFIGRIPTQFGNLSALETLNVAQNDLTGGIESLLGLAELRTVQLGSNFMEDKLDSTLLDSWSKLEVLDISDNMFYGSLPQNLFLTQSLIVGDFHNNNFNGTLPEFVKVSSNSTLKFLALNDNKLSGPMMDERITLLHGLMHLDLSENDFTGPISSSHLGSLTNLRYLFVAFNDKLDLQTIPTEIGLLTSLRDLSFQNTNRFGAIPTEIGLLKNLTLLDFNGNDLEGSLPRQLEALRDLQFLTLKDNPKLEGSIPKEFIVLQKLDTLVLYGTSITSGALALCDSQYGIQTLREFVADCSVLTDCGDPVPGSNSFDETCCSDCCDQSQNGQNVCESTVWYSDVDPQEKYGYGRPNFFFREDDIVDPANLPLQHEQILHAAEHYDQVGEMEAPPPSNSSDYFTHFDTSISTPP